MGFSSALSPGPAEADRKSVFDFKRKTTRSPEHGCGSNTFQMCFPRVCPVVFQWSSLHLCKAGAAFKCNVTQSSGKPVPLVC